MNLKQISAKIGILCSIIFFVSCNNDDEIEYTQDFSSDAQIHSFAVSAQPYTAMDTICFPFLKDTKFSIDQLNSKIYNEVPLPFGTRLARYQTDFKFTGNGGVSKITLQYSDSTPDWNRTDSINYVGLQGFKITAQDGLTVKNYDLNIRIHSIDQDSIRWTSFNAMTNDVDEQKTVVKNSDFYCLHKTGATIGLSVFDKTTGMWTDNNVSNLPTTALIESFIIYGDTFFVINDSGNVYSSTDASNWTDLGNMDIHSILGIIPSKSADEDFLLTVQSTANGYKFAKTKNMSSFDLLKINGSKESIIPNGFPARGFTSVTSTEQKSLLLTGGKDFDGNLKNSVYSIAFKGNEIEYIETGRDNNNNVFQPNEGIATFIYDKKLYLLNDSLFVTSSNWGNTWQVASKKQAFHKDMARGLGQSVIVDEDNYIWIFGGVPNKQEEKDKSKHVWRGRLNSLIP